MNEYINQFRNPLVDCDPEILDIVRTDQEYRIFHGDKALLTPGGNVFAHPSERFIRSLVTDIQMKSSIGSEILSLNGIYIFRKDVLDTGSDPFQNKLNEISDADPFVRIKTNVNQSTVAFRPDEPLFGFSFITLSGLVQEINGFTAGLMSEFTLEESDNHPFTELLTLGYASLDPWKKAIVNLLSALHNSGIVLPLGLALGRISPVEYSKGLVALKIQDPSVFSKVYLESSNARSFLESLVSRGGQERSLLSVIHEGEGDSSEFKSTLRWDIRAGKTNPAIERACLKTISAFLNSRGGVLLIGVRDDGSIEGIETDKFPNEDKFLLHLWTLIRTCLGRDFSPYIRTVLEKAEEKTVCLVYCQPSVRPVFLRQPGFDEEMFIRVGPSSNALDISEALRYIRERFV